MDRALGVIAALAIVAAFVAALLLAAAGHQPTPSLGVYIEPPGTPEDLRLNIAPATLAEANVRTVSSVRALQSAVATGQPRSIWLNRTAMASISPAWLRQQMARGVPIVGINMTRAELGQLLNVDSSGAASDWRPAGLSTFVIYYERLNVPITNPDGSAGVRGGRGGANDAYDPDQPGWLIHAVQKAIQITEEPSPPQ